MTNHKHKQDAKHYMRWYMRNRRLPKPKYEWIKVPRQADFVTRQGKVVSFGCHRYKRIRVDSPRNRQEPLVS